MEFMDVLSIYSRGHGRGSEGEPVCTYDDFYPYPVSILRIRSTQSQICRCVRGNINVLVINCHISNEGSEPFMLLEEEDFSVRKVGIEEARRLFSRERVRVNLTMLLACYSEIFANVFCEFSSMVFCVDKKLKISNTFCGVYAMKLLKQLPPVMDKSAVSTIFKTVYEEVHNGFTAKNKPIISSSHSDASLQQREVFKCFEGSIDHFEFRANQKKDGNPLYSVFDLHLINLFHNNLSSYIYMLEGEDSEHKDFVIQTFSQMFLEKHAFSTIEQKEIEFDSDFLPLKERLEAFFLSDASAKILQINIKSNSKLSQFHSLQRALIRLSNNSSAVIFVNFVQSLSKYEREALKGKMFTQFQSLCKIFSFPVKRTGRAKTLPMKIFEKMTVKRIFGHEKFAPDKLIDALKKISDAFDDRNLASCKEKLDSLLIKFELVG